MAIIDVHTHHPGAKDPEMDGYVAIMDEHHVTAVLVHAVPWEEKDNENVRRAVEKHPGRLFGSAYLDLRDPVAKSLETVAKYAALGFKCVKMFPNLGFDPNDEVHEPVWEAVEAHGLMCLSHCGWIGLMGNDRVQTITASPFHFETPARRHPKINFIFAHFGGGATYLETLVLTSRLTNAYADCCPGWGRWVFENNMPGLNALFFSQFLYGTDSAGKHYPDSIAWWTEKLKAMGRSQADLDAFFYGNAAKLLGLPPARNAQYPIANKE